MKIIADSNIPFLSDYFAQYGELILCDGRHLSAREVKDADMLLIRSVTKINAELLENSKVKFVGSVAAGIDHLDIAWLTEAKIAYHGASGFNAPPVADYIVCLLASLYLKYLPLEEKLRIAIIGVGHVGKLVQARLQKLNCEIITCDPFRAQEENFHHTNLQDIADCDVISLHVPLTKAGDYPTFEFIDKNFLKRQKKNSILVNTSRGGVINYSDLYQHGNQLHWCFDVWPDEPAIDLTLLQKTLTATPHIAGYSIQSKRRGIDMIYQAVCRLGIISPHTIVLPPELKQQLQFAGKDHSWQAIVLGIFNPMIMTSIMRSKLIISDDVSKTFDEMRNTFNYRNEFSFIKVKKDLIKADDRNILTSFGIELI